MPQTQGVRPPPPSLLGNSMQKQVQEAQQNRRAMEQAAASSGRGTSAPVQRTVPKVGRNDDCPCGSGKKYKKCHGQGAT
jgi:preprotein translocase subunit SecA